MVVVCVRSGGGEEGEVGEECLCFGEGLKSNFNHRSWSFTQNLCLCAKKQMETKIMSVMRRQGQKKMEK